MSPEVPCSPCSLSCFCTGFFEHRLPVKNASASSRRAGTLSAASLVPAVGSLLGYQACGNNLGGIQIAEVPGLRVEWRKRACHPVFHPYVGPDPQAHQLSGHWGHLATPTQPRLCPHASSGNKREHIGVARSQAGGA